MFQKIFGVLLIISIAHSKPQNYQTTPVPILKQIDRHNDDGSYSYGYEAADGTFKIETKYPNGEVYGKYGYVGDDGKVRQVEYGASKRGFEPVGAHINVAPPTLSNNLDDPNGDYDDGQYREDPSIYEFEFSEIPSSVPVSGYKTAYQTPQNQYNQPKYQQSQPQPQYTAKSRAQFAPQLAPQPLPQYKQGPQFYNPRPQYRSINHNSEVFRGHPAKNVNLNTGSYSISYSG